jgi:hypothetical protein
MRRRSAAAACAVAALLPATAFGGAREAGGSSIASAAALPVNSVAVASTAPRAGVQYWKIDLGAGDLLAVVFAAVSGPLNDTGICVLPPTTTDAVLAQTRCLSTAPDIRWTNGRVQVVYAAATAGTYYVAAGLADCLRAAAPDSVKPCETYHEGADPVPALTYQIGGQVLKPTSVSVRAPRRVHMHRRLHVAGAVAGAAGGPVRLPAREP